MARRKKTYDDDDGRTIADMSGVSSQPLLIPGRPVGPKKQEHVPEEPERDERPWEKNQDLMSKEEAAGKIMDEILQHKGEKG